MPVTAPTLTSFQYATSLSAPGNVYVMDGQSSITDPALASFPTGPLTLAFWLSTTATAQQTIFRYSSGNSQFVIANPAALEVTLGATSISAICPVINDGVWHHIAVTLAPADASHTAMRIYVDGASVYQNNGIPAVSWPARQTLVLGQAATSGQGYVGSIAEFVAWNAALSARQIAGALAVRQSVSGQGIALYWSMLSASSVTDYGGVIQGGAFGADSALEFRSVQTSVAWSIVTGASYELKVASQSGCFYLEQTVAGTSAMVAGVLPNDVYNALVRAQVSGEWSDWSAPLQLTPILLQPILLDYNDAALSAAWPAVDQQSNYAVYEYQDGSQTPTVTQQTATRLNLSTLLTSTSSYRIVVRALTLNSLGPGNASTQVAAPSFTFTLDETDPVNPALVVTWQAVTNALRYYLTVTKSGASVPALAVMLNPGDTPYRMSRSTIPFQEGDTWTANLRAIGMGYIGLWGPAQGVTISTLAAPALTFSWTDLELDVVWPDIRTQQQQQQGLVVTYDLQLLKDGTVVDHAEGIPNTDVDRKYAFSTSAHNRLGINSVWQTQVRGRAAGVIGPWNTPPTLAAPAGLTLQYDWAQTNPVQVQWTAAGGAQLYFYEVQKQNQVVASAVLADTSGSSNPAVTDSDMITAQVRSLASGTVTVFSAAVPLQIQQYVAPILGQPTASAINHTIAVSWTFDDPDAPRPTYIAQLYEGQTLVDSQSITQASVMFQNNVIMAGAIFNIQVRASEGGNFGKWAPTSITVSNSGVVGQVQGLVVCSTVTGDFECSWQSVAGAGITYTLQISTSPSYSKSGINGTSITIAHGDSYVAIGHTYTVQVRADQGAVSGPWSSAVSVTAGTPNPDCKPKPLHGGDPIDLATGAFSYANTDINVISAFGIQFTTWYSTNTPLPLDNPSYTGKPMGNRWNHSYNTRIAVSDNVAYVVWGTQLPDVYTVPSSVSGAYTKIGAPDGSSLSLGTNGVYTLTARDQTVYTFNRSGVLQSVACPAGNLQQLTYTNGQLSRITDAASRRYLVIAYNADGLVQSVSDSAGRSISYGYNNGNLTGMTDIAGKSRVFTYKPGNLSLIDTITDQNQTTYLKNNYDSQNRVTFQQDGQALMNHLSYGITITYTNITIGNLPGTLVAITDQEGNLTEYQVVNVNAAPLRKTTYLTSDKTQIQRILYTYDGFGRVLTQTVYEGLASHADTRVGNTTRFTLDANGNVQTTTLPNGLVIRVDWSTQNQPVKLTDSLGNVTSWTYESNLPKTQTDPLLQVTTWTYKPGTIKGLIQTQQDANGNTTTFDYYGNGDLKTVSDAASRVVVLVTDSAGRVTNIENRDAQGAVLKTTKLVYGVPDTPSTVKIWMAGMTEAQAFVFQYQYDGLGNQTQVTNPMNAVTSYHYNYNGLLSTVTFPTDDSSTQQTVYDYYRNNNPKQIAYSTAVVESYVYDPLARIIGYTDPNLLMTNYAYAMIFPQQGGPPYNTSVTTTFPPAQSTDSRFTSILISDPAQRPIAFQDAAQRITTWAYTSQHVSTPPPNGSWQQVITTTLPKYDPNQPAYTTVDVLDAVGRPVSHTNEAAKITNIAYTRAQVGAVWNLVETVTDPVQVQTVQTYDPAMRLVGWNKGDSGASTVLAYTYDALDRLLQVTQSFNNSTHVTAVCSYAYANSSVIRASIGRPGDPANVVTVDFNAVNEVVRVGYPDGGLVAWSYYPRGLRKTRLNHRGQTLTYGYDAAGRYISTTLPNGDQVQQVLDGDGNRLVTNQLAGGITTPLITRTFDGLGRMKTRIDNARDTIVSYDYDPTALIVKLTYPDAKTSSRRYDGMGRLHVVTTDWNNLQTIYTYDPVGGIVRIDLPNGCTTSVTFDAAERLTGVHNSKGDILIASIQHQVIDALGQPTQSRLVSPIAPAAQAFAQSFVPNPSNQYTSVDGNNFAYDPDGNTSTLPVTSTAALAYDVYNRLVSYGTDSYAYDADSLRVQTTIGGVTQRYVYDIGGYRNPMVNEAASGNAIVNAVEDAWGLILPVPANSGAAANPLDCALVLTDAAGNIQQRFVYGVGLISQEQADGSQLRVYHYDDAGNTVALTDVQGAITDRFAYDPYGTVTARSGSSPCPFVYGGRYGVMADANGLSFMRARSYTPLYRRFLQRDPLPGNLFSPQTLNLYSYAGNAPLTFSDPLGLDRGGCGIWCGLGIAAGIVGVGAIVYGIYSAIAGAGAGGAGVGVGVEGSRLGGLGSGGNGGGRGGNGGRRLPGNGPSGPPSGWGWRRGTGSGSGQTLRNRFTNQSWFRNDVEMDDLSRVLNSGLRTSERASAEELASLLSDV